MIINIIHYTLKHLCEETVLCSINILYSDFMYQHTDASTSSCLAGNTDFIFIFDIIFYFKHLAI